MLMSSFSGTKGRGMTLPRSAKSFVPLVHDVSALNTCEKCYAADNLVGKVGQGTNGSWVFDALGANDSQIRYRFYTGSNPYELSDKALLFQVAHGAWEVHVPQTVPQTSHSVIDVSSSTADQDTDEEPVSSNDADDPVQQPERHDIDSLPEAAGRAASGSASSSSSASRPTDGAASREDDVTAQRSGLEDAPAMGPTHHHASVEQAEPEDFTTVGTPLNGFSMGRGEPEDGPTVGFSQNDATGQPGRSDSGDSAGTSEDGAAASQGPVKGSENKGKRASGDTKEQERQAEYAEMLQGMRRIRKNAEVCHIPVHV